MKISSEFPYESKFIKVKESKIHYIDEGKGDAMLFLHGNPTSSYLWRNIIPYMKDTSRCIAPDLIGMGKSDKPDLAYSFEDHYEYVEEFIEKLGLKKVTLVLHDWGSALGFHYANLHRSNVKGIAFMESVYAPMSWAEFPTQFKIGFRLMRTPFLGWLMISVGNAFIKKMLPAAIVRSLTKEEFAQYSNSYPSIRSRKPLRVWPTQVPIDQKPRSVHDKVAAYSKWLTQTTIPKLCLYAHPGAIIREGAVKFIKENFPNTTLVDIGEGIHFVQEDHPDIIGREIAKWHRNI